MKVIKFVLAVITVIFFIPNMFHLWFGMQLSEDIGDNVKNLFFLILALLNSIFVWWMIYEIFIK